MDDIYIVIKGWMIHRLNLKGNALMVYAFIYGFSQDGNNEYTGASTYISNLLQVTKRSVLSALNDLCGKRYIIKREYVINGVKYCAYRVNKELCSDYIGGEKSSQVVKKVHRSGEEISSEVVKKDDLGGEKISPNNKDIINIDKKEYNTQFNFLQSLIDAGVDRQIAEEYMQVRKVKRATNTLTAFKGLEREAKKANISLNDAIRICVERSWQGFKAEWYKKDYGVKDWDVDISTSYSDWDDVLKRQNQ